MDFVASEFVALDELHSSIADRLRRFLGTGNPDQAWADLALAHNDRAAALLAVCHALSRIDLHKGGGASISALEMTTDVRQLAGDRTYFVLDTSEFDAWRAASAKFTIRLADGTTETGQVRFNQGGFGGSLHEGFSVQGFTSTLKVPRIQWNYRNCDSFADIDIDRFRPLDAIRHLSYANSDPRQWWDDYVAKFGNPGFRVRRVGGVEPDEVALASQCPLDRDRLSVDERARALEIASQFEAQMRQSGDFREAVEMSTDRETTAAWLASPELSPLQGVVARSVLVEASPDELRAYYLSRAAVQWRQLHRGAAFEAAGAEPSPATRSIAAGDAALAAAIDASTMALSEPVETIEQLTSVRRRLEVADRMNAASEPPQARAAMRALDSAEPAVWLADAGGGPQSRTMVVQLRDVQLVLVSIGDRIEIASALPWR